MQTDVEDETMHDEPNEHDQQLWNLQDQLLRTEAMVEEREAQFERLKQHCDMLEETMKGMQCSEDKLRDELISLLRRQYRKTPRGHCLHYSTKCMHWQNGQELTICMNCRDEGAVSRDSEASQSGS